MSKFTQPDEYVEILEKKKNENQHSLSLCVFMTTLCKSTYYFACENAQKGQSVMDIGVYIGSNLVFTIEAKVLPIPKYEGSTPHQYVYGQGGGIERFKEGNHGVDNRNRMINPNGMIAYIKQHDFQYWFEKVNVGYI
ncbi:MAG: hypothetical protein ACKVTZ_13635 [Bacteroidia bacterium]